MLAGVLLAATTGCTDGAGSGGSPGTASAGTPGDGVVISTVSAGGLIEQARAGGASEEQLAVLSRGAASVTFADYEAAVGLTIRCLRDAGIDVVGDDVVEPRGFPEIRYSFSGTSAGRSDAVTLDVADGCIDRHSHWIEAAYQTSPTSVEAIEQHFAPYRPAVVACVTENNGTVEDTAIWDEVVVASSDVKERTGVDCLAKAGVPGG